MCLYTHINILTAYFKNKPKIPLWCKYHTLYLNGVKYLKKKKREKLERWGASSAFKRRSGIGDIYPPNQDESSDVGGALNAAQNNPGG